MIVLIAQHWQLWPLFKSKLKIQKTVNSEVISKCDIFLFRFKTVVVSSWSNVDRLRSYTMFLLFPKCERTTFQRLLYRESRRISYAISIRFYSPTADVCLVTPLNVDTRENNVYLEPHLRFRSNCQYFFFFTVLILVYWITPIASRASNG